MRQRMDLKAAWHVAALSRQQRLPSLASLLRPPDQTAIDTEQAWHKAKIWARANHAKTTGH